MLRRREAGWRYASVVNLIPTRWYTMLCMPSFFGLALVTLGVWMVWRSLRRVEAPKGARRGVAVAAFGACVLYLASTPLVATWLAWSLERQTPFVTIAQVPTAGAIVVLGGGQSGFLAENGDLHRQTHHAGDRLERGLEAFKAGKAPLFVVGGGTMPMPGEPLVGEYLRELAIDRGVPAAAVLRCGRALYTTDEGVEIARMLRERGVDSIILCTSAYHMPRARLVYERLGFRVTPLPADFDTQGYAERFSPLLLVPRGLALGQTESCLKEWLGLTLGRLLGSA